MIIGIGGVSRAGKTSLALQVQKWYGSVVLLHQDDYILPENEMPTIRGHIDWERPDAYDYERLIKAVELAQEEYDIVVVEGLMVLCHSALTNLMDKTIYIRITKEAFLSRKTLDKRWGDEPDWYIEHIWNSHFAYCNKTNDNNQVLLVDGELINEDEIKSYIESKNLKTYIMITKTIEIEDLVNDFPFSVKYLADQGIRCIACGEPIWGTLEEASKEKGFDDKKIQSFVDDLNKISETNNSGEEKISQVEGVKKMDL